MTKKIYKTAVIALILYTFLGLNAMAAIDVNLKYGQTSTEVTELQDFLVDKGLLNVSPTGYFGLLTLNAVKAYQTSKAIPNTGYVGVLTRTAINSELEVATASSTEAEITETGTTTPIVNTYTPPVVNPIVDTPTTTVGSVPSIKPPLYPIVNGICSDTQPCAVTTCKQANNFLNSAKDSETSYNKLFQDLLINSGLSYLINDNGIDSLSDSQKVEYEKLVSQRDQRIINAKGNQTLGYELVNYYCY